MINYDEWEKKYKEEHQIKCPHCGYVLEGEDTYPFISLYGEDSEGEAECSSCDRVFFVREHVDRTWDVQLCEFD